MTTNNIDIDTAHGVTCGISTINNEETIIKNANFSLEIIRLFPKAVMKGRARN